MIIGIGNKKGGTGKSTLAINILVHLNDLGFPAGFIDTDGKEGGLFATATQIRDELGEDAFPIHTATTLEQIDQAVTSLQSTGHHVILDSPGETGDQATALCLLSDLVLVPVCLSPKDVLQTVELLTMIQFQQRRNPGKPEAVIVLSKTRKGDIAAPGMRKNFEQFGIPIAETEIRYRKSIERLATVMRLPNAFKKDGPGVDLRDLIQETILPKLDPTRRTANE
jgi:chromosome partitioning protein